VHHLYLFNVSLDCFSLKINTAKVKVNHNKILRIFDTPSPILIRHHRFPPQRADAEKAAPEVTDTAFCWGRFAANVAAGEKLVGDNSFAGASFSARTAVDASVGVDYVDFAFRD
jgi:hypothetical protein